MADQRGNYLSADNQSGGGERPRVQVYIASKFRPNDKVYLSTGGGRALQGPYLVATVPEPQKYTLCAEDGSTAEGGRVVGESELSWA
ncbi:hypothetical protein F5B20DRAFT_521116 [Whalleya microplaca]|nr:hypothetical protein F5B20DRAFT_521116 [Whalleya microplaca]